jgi:uncharacterized iron-regulated protein
MTKFLFMRSIIIGIALLIGVVAYGQDVQAYQIFTKDGKKTSFKKLVKHGLKQDVILFGELHNSAIAHWLQLELTKSLNERDSIALGAEMFEADNQDELDDYFNEKIDAKAFDTLARLWSNYNTDYKPIVEFAKNNDLPFIATNIPRRYASLVYKKGFEGLDTISAEEKSCMAPLPIAYDSSLPGYQKMMKMMPGHANENFPKAQAIKDATMAHFMYQEMIRTGHLFIHLNGAFHSNNFDGIYWYLKQLDPGMQIGTISTVLQSDVTKLEKENEGLADFIIVVDEDVTSTY